jgi:hypothetical protein
LERIGLGGIVVDDLTVDLGVRGLALMKFYADVPMSLADASLVSITDQRRDLRIVTFVSDSAGTERAMGSRRCYSMVERAAAILHPPSGRACGKRSSTERI